MWRSPAGSSCLLVKGEKNSSLEWALLADRRGYQNGIDPMKVEIEWPKSDMWPPAPILFHPVLSADNVIKSIATMLCIAHQAQIGIPFSSHQRHASAVWR